MRKTTLCVLIGTLFVLTSCLNDDDNVIQCAQDLGYIKTVNNTVCAATSYGYVTSPEIQRLKPNECYILGYTITRAAQNDIYTADNVFNISTKPLGQTSLLQAAPPVESVNSASVSNLNIPIYSSTTYMGDRWMFNYSALAKDSTKITAYFYYDKDNQVDKDGKNVKQENKVILDVAFVKTEVNGDNSVAKERRFASIGNLESLRTFPNFKKVESNPGGGLYATLLVQFRYHKYISTDKSELSYLGAWNLDTTKPDRVYSLKEILYTND